MDDEEKKKSEIPNAHAWQNDDSKVGLFFHACHENYKSYMGEKSDTVRLKLYAVYKQATVGDCKEDKPFDKLKREKWEEWMKFKGTSKVAAMRRYITLLRQLDPQLIVVEVHEAPPSGFPETAMGGSICARANCKAGCLQPLLGSDRKSTPLETTLENDRTLLSYEGLREWMVREGKQIRCQYGVHIPITPGQSKPFEAWFDHAGCGGFSPYNRNADTTLPKLVEKVLARAFRRAHQMELHPKDYHYDERVAQVQQCMGVRQAFYELTGHFYQYMVPCDRNTSHCNAKRRANSGRNHTHPLELEFPQVDYEDYKQTATLRKELQRVGVSPSTGVYLHDTSAESADGKVLGLEEREKILSRRLANHHRLNFNVQEARRSQRARRFWLPKQRTRMLAAQAIETANQLRKAIAANNTELMVTLVRRGASPNTETEGGLTALIRAVLNSDKALFRQLTEGGADVNYASQKTGLSPLAWACRRGDLVMCHAVLETDDVSPGLPGPTGMTAIMAAAAAGQKEPCNIIDEWVQEHGVAGSLESGRLVNFQNKQGETALHYAARRRQLLLCKHLLYMGCNKAQKNKAGRTAAFEARDLGFTELANWLDATKISGKKSSESQSDRNAERKARVAEGKMLRCLEKGLLRGQEDQLSSTRDDDRPGSRGRPGSRRKTRGRGSSRGSSREKNPDDDGRPRSSQEALALMKREMDAEEAKATALAKANESNDSALVELRQLADRTVSLVVQEDDQPVPLPISLDLIMKDTAAPNFETEQGTTALMSAAYAGQAYAVRMLISEGCDVNFQNRNGRTPLMAAAAGGNVRCVIELLRADANLDIMDNESKTAGRYATEASMFNIAKLLVNFSTVGLSKALESFMSHDVKTSKKEALMVQYGATPGAVGGDGDNPDSYTWRLPPLDPRANPLMDDLRREKERQAKHEAQREEARRKAMEERKAIEDAEKEKERQAALAAKALEPPEPVPKVSLYVHVIKARQLLATDKGGTSDPYATVELVDVATGKVYTPPDRNKKAKPFKIKTKAIKKNCDPNWEDNGEPEVLWEHILDDRDGLPQLAIRATVFDQDMLTSTCLGGATVKLSNLDCQALRGEHFVDTWYDLEKVKKMKEDATGAIQLRLRIEGGGSHDDWVAARATSKDAEGSSRPTSSRSNSSSSSSEGDSSRPDTGAGSRPGTGSRPQSKGLQRTAVFNPTEAAAALESSLDGETLVSEVTGAGASASSDGISAVRAAYFPGLDKGGDGAESAKDRSGVDRGAEDGKEEDEEEAEEVIPDMDDFLASFDMENSDWMREHNKFVSDRKAWQRRQTDIRNQAAADIRALENASLSEDESVRYWQLLERDAKRKEAALKALELKRNPPKPHEVMDNLVPLQTTQDADMETMQRIDRSTDISAEEMNQMMWLKALGFAKRRIAARLSAAEDAYLARQQAALEQRRTINSLSDVSKAAMARKKLLDQSNAAMIEVNKLAKMVTGRGGKEVREESANSLVMSDGLELWKGRMEEVKRRWVQEDELPADAAAAKKHPDLFVRPPEMDYASFLIGQRKYDEAEGLLRDVMDTQEKAGMRYSAMPGAKFAVGLCHRGLAAIDEARNRVHDALENRKVSLELMAPSVDATHPEMRVAVDLIAGTYMLLKDWDLAEALYSSIAMQLEGSHKEDRLKMIEHMNRRAARVSTHRDRAGMAAEDAQSRQSEAYFRDPSLAKAQRLGRTEEYLEALLGEAYRVSVIARKDFKILVNKKGGALPTCLGFWLAANDFRHTDPEDAGFAFACKRLYKAYIRPPAKLPMLTQGVRKEIEDAINDPHKDMYCAAQSLVLKVLFTSVFASSKKPWIASDAGKLWKTSRVVALDIRKDNAIRRMQTKIRADQATAYEERIRAKAEYLANRKKAREAEKRAAEKSRRVKEEEALLLAADGELSGRSQSGSKDDADSIAGSSLSTLSNPRAAPLEVGQEKPKKKKADGLPSL